MGTTLRPFALRRAKRFGGTLSGAREAGAREADERSRLGGLALRPGFRLKARSPSIEPSGRGR
jgi:hypothetical protein